MQMCQEMPDAQFESDIAAGQPAKYQVQWTLGHRHQIEGR